MKKIIIVTIILTTLYACTRSNHLQLNRSEQRYKSFVSQAAHSAPADAIGLFETVFKDFKKGATEANIRALYADEIYFNDTFIIIDNIDELVTHMVKTAAQVDVTKVDIHEVIKGQSDYYLKWTMYMSFSVFGKQVDSVSMGMTQLRFNDEGKITLHQDYWDGAENFYEHLPVLGLLVKKVKAQL